MRVIVDTRVLVGHALAGDLDVLTRDGQFAEYGVRLGVNAGDERADRRGGMMRHMLEPGTKAPAFTLPDQDGNPVKLSDLKGRRVVLYFYPKADTPGCTTQACSIRDHADDYAQRDVVVLGVSPDPVNKVKKFHEKFDMNFTLLADEDHAVAEQYGVWAEKSMYGRTYWGNLRATFVIDAEGTITHVFPKVSPKTHDDVVLAALDEG